MDILGYIHNDQSSSLVSRPPFQILLNDDIN